MSGVFGNDNLAHVRGSQYLTVDASSDTITLPINVQAVEVYSDVACWVYIGNPGETPTAAAPGAEKTGIFGFYLPPTIVYTVPVSMGLPASPVKIAAIRDSSSGTLYVNYRSFV